MKNNDYSKNVKDYAKWSKVDTITTIGIMFFSILHALLVVLEEFTDFEIKAPFFYNIIFTWVMLAVFLVLITFLMISYVKTRKFRKLIEQRENSENEELSEQKCDK